MRLAEDRVRADYGFIPDLTQSIRQNARRDGERQPAGRGPLRNPLRQMAPPGVDRDPARWRIRGVSPGGHPHDLYDQAVR